MAQGVWKLKHITVSSNCVTSADVKTLLDAAIPSGYTAAYIADDNQDWTNYSNNHFVYALAMNGSLYTWGRYKDSDGTLVNGSSWGTGSALTAAQGDKYTICYQ